MACNFGRYDFTASYDRLIGYKWLHHPSRKIMEVEVAQGFILIVHTIRYSTVDVRYRSSLSALHLSEKTAIRSVEVVPKMLTRR